MRELVDIVTSDEPPLARTVDDVVSAGRRVQRRRRAAGWAAAGLTVVTVAAAIGVPQLARERSVAQIPGASGPSASASPASGSFATDAAPFTFTFRGYAAGKIQVDTPLVVSTAYQIAAVHMNAGGPAHLFGYLVVYRPGAYQPTGQPNVTVAGRPGIEPGLSNNGAMFHRVLAWQYTDGAWATFDTFSSEAASPSAPELRTAAAGLKPATPVAAKVPFTMRYLPAGFRPVVVGSHAMAGLDGIASAGEGDFGGVVFAKPAPDPTRLTQPWNETGGNGIPGSFELFIVPNHNSNQALKPGEQPPAQPRCAHGICNAWSPDGAVNIQVAREGNAISDVEMTKVLNGITLANVTDEATWSDASKAIPVAP